MGMAIDVKDNDYIVNVRILNAKKSADSGGLSYQQKVPSTVYEAKGKTILSAISNLNQVVPKEPYFANMKVLILSNNIIEDKLTNIFDYFLRYEESRKEFLTVITKSGKAKSVLELVTPLEPLASINLEYTADLEQQADGSNYFMSFDELYAKTKSKYIDAVLPSVIIKGDLKKGGKDDNISSTKAKTDFYYKGLAIFKGTKVVGYLNHKETIGYNLIRGSFKNGDITFSCNNNNDYASAYLYDGKSTTQVDVKNKRIMVTFNVKAVIGENNCNVDLTKSKNINIFKKQLSKKITKTIKNTVKKVNIEYKSRALGFVEMVYKEDTAYYRKNEKNIDDILSTYELKTKMNIDLKRKGSTVNTTKEEKA